MLTECALAVEVAEDRRHVSIAAAGWLDGFVTVEVAAYLSGVDQAVTTMLELRAERTVHPVVVDPRSGAANLIKPLRSAKIRVTEPSPTDVVAAHGEFLDRAAAGALRHVSSPELDAAVRAGTERRLSGATAWDRRGGGPVDVSPAVAAELAVWGLLTVPPPPRPMLLVAGRPDRGGDDGSVNLHRSRKVPALLPRPVPSASDYRTESIS
jgi:hypothetical protein